MPTIIKIFNTDDSINYLFKRIFFTLDGTFGYIIPTDIISKNELIKLVLDESNLVIDIRLLKIKSMNIELNKIEEIKLSLFSYIYNNINYITII